MTAPDPAPELEPIKTPVLPGYTGRKGKTMRKLKEFYYLATLGEEERRLAVPIMLTEGHEIVNIVKHTTRLLALTPVPNKKELLDGVDAFNQYFDSKGILNPNLSDFYINCHVIN